MTVNAYVFAWDNSGIEAIVPVSEYEHWETDNALRRLSGQAMRPNPMTDIINRLMLRARHNPQRHYEIYAIDCDESFTPSVWSELWHSDPQGCADLVRGRGVQLYSDRLASGLTIR